MESKEELGVVSDNDDLDEDISRLQIILQDDDPDGGDSDVELIVWNNKQQQQNAHFYQGSRDEDFQSQPSRPSTSSDVTASSLPTTSMCTDADDVGFKLDISAVNADSCLAINRAYQEVLLDQLRQIEVSLAENRARQKTVQAEIDNDCKSSSKSTDKRHCLLFNTPYFKDEQGAIPPFNEDVAVKESIQEQKQVVKPKQGWTKEERKKLVSAVGRDALEQLTRPILSKLELETDKIQRCGTKEDIDAAKSRIQDLRQQVSEKRKTPMDQLLNNVDAKNIDFLKISVVTFKGKFDAVECDSMWRNVLRPGINRGKWTEQEEERLDNLAIEHEGRNWQLISRELRTNRTPFQCLQHYQQKVALSNSSEWTAEEDEILKEAVESCRSGTVKIQWYQVAYFLENRSADMCYNRWRKVNPSIKRGRWTAKEDCDLISAVDMLGTKDWMRVADLVPQRQAHQCRERWLNVLCPMLGNRGTYDEDKQLISLHIQEEGNWNQMAQKMRCWTEKQLQSRYKKLLTWKKKTADFYNMVEDCKEPNVPVGYCRHDNGAVLPLTAYYQKEMATEEERLVMEKHEVYLKSYAKTHSADLGEYHQQVMDWNNNDIVVPRPPPVQRYEGQTIQAIRNRHLELKNIVKVEENDMTDSQAMIRRVASTLKKGSSKNPSLNRLSNLLLKNSALTVKELLDIKHFMAEVEATGELGSKTHKKLLREFRSQWQNRGKKKRRKMKEEAWTSGESDGSGESEGEVWNESGAEEEKEAEEYQDADKEEEEEGEVMKETVKRPLSEEFKSKRNQALREHIGVNNRLRQIVESKMDLSNLAQASRKHYKMYPDTVLWKHRYKDAADEDKMRKKSLMILMKTLDVDACSTYRKAHAAKRQSTAAALLLTTKRNSHRTRRSTIKVEPANNETNEAVDALLELKDELNMDELETDVSGMDDNIQMGNSPVPGRSNEEAPVADIGDPAKHLPYVPPNATNLHGLRSLLLTHRCLFDSAMCHLLDMKAVERLQVMKDLVHSPECFSLLRAKRPARTFVKTEADEDGFTSALFKARESSQYKQLMARFVSVFGWPALLSTVETKEMRPPDNESPQQTGKAQRGTHRDKGTPQQSEEAPASTQGDKESPQEAGDAQSESEHIASDNEEETVVAMEEEMLGTKMTDEEAINKLVQKIMDRYKAARDTKKKGYAKKMSEKMMKATYERERKKVLKRLGVLERMEEYERKRNEQTSADGTGSASHQYGCQEVATSCMETTQTSNTGELTAAGESAMGVSTTGDGDGDTGITETQSFASQSSTLTDMVAIPGNEISQDDPPAARKVAGRPRGGKNRVDLPADVAEVRRSSRPMQQSWKEALMAKPTTQRKRKPKSPKLKQLQEILPEMDNIISHISEPIRENIISSVGKGHSDAAGAADKGQDQNKAASNKGESHARKALKKGPSCFKATSAKGRTTTAANKMKGHVSLDPNKGQGHFTTSDKVHDKVSGVSSNYQGQIIMAASDKSQDIVTEASKEDHGQIIEILDNSQGYIIAASDQSHGEVSAVSNECLDQQKAMSGNGLVTAASDNDHREIQAYLEKGQGQITQCTEKGPGYVLMDRSSSSSPSNMLIATPVHFPASPAPRVTSRIKKAPSVNEIMVYPSGIHRVANQKLLSKSRPAQSPAQSDEVQHSPVAKAAKQVSLLKSSTCSGTRSLLESSTAAESTSIIASKTESTSFAKPCVTSVDGSLLQPLTTTENKSLLKSDAAVSCDTSDLGHQVNPGYQKSILVHETNLSTAKSAEVERKQKGPKQKKMKTGTETSEETLEKADDVNSVGKISKKPEQPNIGESVSVETACQKKPAANKGTTVAKSQSRPRKAASKSRPKASSKADSETLSNVGTIYVRNSTSEGAKKCNKTVSLLTAAVQERIRKKIEDSLSVRSESPGSPTSTPSSSCPGIVSSAGVQKMDPASNIEVIVVELDKKKKVQGADIGSRSTTRKSPASVPNTSFQSSSPPDVVPSANVLTVDQASIVRVIEVAEDKRKPVQGADVSAISTKRKSQDIAEEKKDTDVSSSSFKKLRAVLAASDEELKTGQLGGLASTEN